MSDHLLPFLFQGEALVRVVTRDGLPWFVALDVCNVLGISRHRDAVSRLADDERGSVIVDTLGGPQEVSAVSESGLYALIFRSRKPAAVAFRKWVTSEVLPQIRQTGGYAGGERPKPPRQTIEGDELRPMVEIPPQQWSLEHWRVYFAALREYNRLGGTSWALWIAEFMNGPLPREEGGRRQLAFMLVMPKDEPASG